MLVTRAERHVINKNHKMFNICDEYCFKAKNLYNYANYIVRQEFIKNGNYINYNAMTRDIKHSEPFRDIGSNSAQLTLRLLEKDWKSFFEGVKGYKKNPNKYLGRPKLPRYKKKDGRTNCMLTNMQTRVEDGYLFFAFKPFKPYNNIIKTKFKGRLLQTRIKPQGGCYILELVYEIEAPEIKENNNRIIGIDLGLNNFATIVNNIGEKPIVINGKGIKSYNQYWNKQMACYKSLANKNNKLDWTKRLQTLTNKRYNKIEHFLHCSSKFIVDYCLGLKINTMVIGYNKGWKQDINIGKATQNFVQIPYYEFLKKLQYKCEDVGIKLITTEESYTSGTSFLDNELPVKESYDKNRRLYRGLFKSNSGILINADVNGAYQIMKKVFSNVFTDGIEGVGLHPLVVSL